MKSTLIAAAMAGLFGLPGFAGAADGKMVFALVPKNMNNPFFDQARDGCKKAEKESAGKIECRYIGPGEHGGGDEQVKVVQDLITAKVNGIAVSPSNAPAMAKVLERAKAAGIPVTTWDSDLLPKDKGLRSTYVGTKNYDIGVNLAKLGVDCGVGTVFRKQAAQEYLGILGSPESPQCARGASLIDRLAG